MRKAALLQRKGRDMSVYAPDLVECKSPYKNKRRDDYLRANHFVDPAILADDLHLSEWFVKMRLRQLKLSACTCSLRKGK